MSVLFVTLGNAENDPRTWSFVKSLTARNIECSTLEIDAITRDNLRNSITTHIAVIECQQEKYLRRTKIWVSSRPYDLLAATLVNQGVPKTIFEWEFKDSASTTTPEHRYFINVCKKVFVGLSIFIEINRNNLPNVMVGEDFLVMPAVMSVGQLFGIPTVYDAHELFTSSTNLYNEAVLSQDTEDYWRELEESIWRDVDLLISVSPGITRFMLDSAPAANIVTVPNFVPLGSSKVADKKDFDKKKLRFVYLGNLAKYREVDSLVMQWAALDNPPSLHLFIPSSEYLSELKSLTPVNSCIYFEEPVAPSQIVETLCSFDVGVLPYSYPYPYSEASPNKFGEYLAAGLPVFAHRQPFTSSLIDEFALGRAVDFKDNDQFKIALDEMCNEKNFATFKTNVNSAFQNNLNWDLYIASAIDQIVRFSTSKPLYPKEFRLGFEFSQKSGDLMKVAHKSLKIQVLAESLIDRFHGQLARFYRRCYKYRVLRRPLNMLSKLIGT